MDIRIHLYVHKQSYTIVSAIHNLICFIRYLYKILGILCIYNFQFLFESWSLVINIQFLICSLILSCVFANYESNSFIYQFSFWIHICQGFKNIIRVRISLAYTLLKELNTSLPY